MSSIIKLKIQNSSDDCCSFLVALSLCILFASHFALSITIIYQLYIHGFIILFGFHISFICLILFLSWVFAAYFFIKGEDEDIPNPTSPFTLILLFITAGKCDILTNPISKCFISLNNTFCCCQVLNYIIVVLLLPIFVCFGPFYSISFVFIKEEDGFAFGVYYQLSLIIPNTIIQIIIICLSIKSLPMITTIVSMISVGVGITYLIIIIFLSFDLLKYDNKKYLYCLPFMINIELLSIFSMIFIVSFMDLWKSDFQDIEYILLLICFINIFIPNIPFYKSYLMEYYCDILRNNDVLEYVLKNRNSSTRRDKMFCVLLCIAQKNNTSIYELINYNQESDRLLNQSKVMTNQQIVMKQYKYSQMKKKEKIELINSNAKHDNVYKQIMIFIFTMSSFIAFVSPIVWSVWITIHNELHNTAEFIFIWLMVGCYVLLIFGFIFYIIMNKLKLSWESIKYMLMFKRFRYSRYEIELLKVNKYYDRFPVIQLVFDTFQYDIGMIIILYLFE